MTKTLKNLKNQDSEYFSEKRVSVSGGTMLFLVFNILLITGFCKFSFYVLKNHRSAVERDTLVKTYVDVQPYNSGKRAYTALNIQDKTAPAPLFTNKETTVFSPLAEKKEILAEKQKNVPRFPSIAKSAKRMPVIRSTKQPPADLPLSQEVPIIKSMAQNDSPAVSLDNLMVSGLNLLDESEKTIASSEILLRETSSSEQEIIKNTELPLQSESKEKETFAGNSPIKKESVERKSNNETRWVDAAELRRRLASLTAQAPSPKDDERLQQNTALLQMNNAKQIASSDTKTISDIQDDAPLNNKVSPLQQKDSPQKTSKETSDNKSSAVAATALQETKGESPSSVQIAVVQDVPFAGTAQVPDSNQNNAFLPNPAHNATLAGNSPSLWKVAKIKEPASGNLTDTPKEEKKQIAEKKVESENLPQTTGKETIYRNGRAVASIQNQEKKSLNWLDRQKAAVWTSMAQSDTPSVWSSATETASASADKARAFRVAEEQQSTAAETNVINSAPVRVVTESAQPEAKENPLLLPLGTPTATQTIPTINSPVLANAPSSPVNSNKTTAVETEKQEKTNPAAEEGLMNKFFSFFGKTENTNSLPNIGSGNPLPEENSKQENKSLSDKPKAKEKDSSAIPLPSKTKTEEKQIIPTELRLTFKPNSTEMSAQSIKWIKAFGQKAKKDIQNAVEVRMSNMDPTLQNKRFAIIRSTLIGVGMENVQIIPVMTDRTPHTVVLRMIVLPEEGYTEYTTENSGVKERLYYKQW